MKGKTIFNLSDTFPSLSFHPLLWLILNCFGLLNTAWRFLTCHSSSVCPKKHWSNSCACVFCFYYLVPCVFYLRLWWLLFFKEQVASVWSLWCRMWFAHMSCSHACVSFLCLLFESLFFCVSRASCLCLASVLQAVVCPQLLQSCLCVILVFVFRPFLSKYCDSEES